jgi:hypothetical protein
MFWLAIGATVIIAVAIAVAFMVSNRRRDALGSVSATWIAEHQGDSR